MLWMAVLVCVSMHVLYNLVSNVEHTGQIDFEERFKRPSLNVLKKYIREVEAMKFLHNVVSLKQLASKLKQNSRGNGEEIMKQVRLCISMCI